jgi:retron-type reverse transcriptase
VPPPSKLGGQFRFRLQWRCRRVRFRLGRVSRTHRLFDIPKKEVWDAYKRVKVSQGAAHSGSQNSRLFSRTTSTSSRTGFVGELFPPPVRPVDIPKADGGTRPLGIPTVADRIAQEVARHYLTPYLEAVFHTECYGLSLSHLRQKTILAEWPRRYHQ